MELTKGLKFRCEAVNATATIISADITTELVMVEIITDNTESRNSETYVDSISYSGTLKGFEFGEYTLLL